MGSFPDPRLGPAQVLLVVSKQGVSHVQSLLLVEKRAVGRWGFALGFLPQPIIWWVDGGWESRQECNKVSWSERPTHRAPNTPA